MDEKDQKINDLLDLLLDPDPLISLAALDSLLHLPANNFRQEDLKRLAKCGIKVFEAFAQVALVKFYLKSVK